MSGQKIGYVGREIARLLAPVLDLDDVPPISATIAERPTVARSAVQEDVRAALEAYDAVRIQITVAPR
jgi:hypothetical protein